MIPAKEMYGEQVSSGAAEKIDVMEAVSAWYGKGLERFAEVQKKTIELAADQNAELIDTWKKMAQLVPGAPGVFLLDLAASGFERYVETHKTAIDTMLEQGKAVTDLMKERSLSASKVADEAKAILQQTVEQTVSTQKRALEYSAANTKVMIEKTRQQLGLSSVPNEVVDSFDRGIDTFVESQKELIDIAAMPFVGAGK